VTGAVAAHDEGPSGYRVCDFRELSGVLPDFSPAVLTTYAMTHSKGGAQQEPPAFPAWKAFVIQFSRETEGAAVFSGRAEHLSSGRRAHFESPEELVAALRKLLVELGTQ